MARSVLVFSAMAQTRTTQALNVDASMLESAFFLEQDKVLIERLRALRQMEETKETLSSVSGITNDAVLARLVELKVQAEHLAALATVPLIEVAWADGTIDPREREIVLAHANARGIKPGTIEHDLLERWLVHRPEPSLLEGWKTYTRGLCERMTAEERAQLKDELLHATQSTAQAAGGFLGLGRVSKEEQAVLDALAATFDLPPTP